jgi:hypothetical protein
MLDNYIEDDFTKRSDDRHLLHTKEEQEDKRIIVLNVKYRYLDESNRALKFKHITLQISTVI